MMLKAIHPDCTAALDFEIKPFQTPNDVQVLQAWTGVEASCLDPLYESIAAADFMESVMVWQHDEPVLQADLCKAVFDELSSCFTVAPGDYTLRLQFPDTISDQLVQQALQALIRYSFEKKSARRLIVPVYEKNLLLKNWLQQANSTLVQGVQYKPLQRLYFLDRAEH